MMKIHKSLCECSRKGERGGRRGYECLCPCGGKLLQGFRMQINCVKTLPATKCAAAAVAATAVASASATADCDCDGNGDCDAVTRAEQTNNEDECKQQTAKHQANSRRLRGCECKEKCLRGRGREREGKARGGNRKCTNLSKQWAETEQRVEPPSWDAEPEEEEQLSAQVRKKHIANRVYTTGMYSSHKLIRISLKRYTYIHLR